jgi:hypothetical protein
MESLYVISLIVSSRFMHPSPASCHRLTLRVGDYRILPALPARTISILSVKHRTPIC